MKKHQIIILICYIICTVAILTIASILMHNALNLDSTWIGFLGNVIGGIITFLSVLMTILYTQRINRNTIAISNEPYIIIEECQSNSQSNSYLLDIVPAENADNYSYTPDEIVTISIKNIGKGPACNIAVNNVSTSLTRKNNEKDYFKLNEPFIIKKLIPNHKIEVMICFSRTDTPYKGLVSISFSYEDVIGNTIEDRIIHVAKMEDEIRVFGNN